MTVRLRAWLAILAVAVGVYFIGRWQGAASVADAAAVANAENILHLKAPYLKRIAQLQRIEGQHYASALLWRHRADSLRAARVDTVALGTDSGLAANWRSIADAEHHAASECLVSVSACQERATVAEGRAAALDSSLAGLLKVKDCHVLFIRCPSRAATFLVGAGLGFIGGAWIEKK